uniref:Chemokine interleukin-8-like domain-containing protein n=1 Tax=Astyanax mexicanus TaxID=7994 RepID=A0A8B9GNE8_ASTMX
MNHSILAIAVLACVLFSMSEGKFIHCIMQKTPIRIKRIQRFETIAVGPHCKTEQVIRTARRCFQKKKKKNERLQEELCLN